MTIVRNRRLTRRATGALSLALGIAYHISAAAVSAAPLLDLEGKINELTQQATTLGRGLALLSVVLTFLYMILEPALPQFARENKGLLGRVVMGCIGFGLATDIVGFFF